MRCGRQLACSLVLLLAASGRGAGQRTRHASAHSSDPRDIARKDAATRWMGDWGDGAGDWAAWARGGQRQGVHPEEMEMLGVRFRVWEDASTAPQFVVRRWMHDEPWERPPPKRVRVRLPRS